MSMWHVSFRRACCLRKGRALLNFGMITTGALAVSANRAFAEGPTATILALPVEWLAAHIETVLSVAGGIAAFTISTTCVLKQMRDTQRWNVRKTSEEMLSAMITGDFPKLMDRLILEFGWDILAHTPYDIIAKNLTDSQLAQVDVILRNILRHLEVICINMKNRIIDEEICFDYLRSIMTTFHVNCDSFILKERKRRENSDIFENTEAYGKKWLGIMRMKSDGVPHEQLRLQFGIAK